MDWWKDELGKLVLNSNFSCGKNINFNWAKK